MEIDQVTEVLVLDRDLRNLGTRREVVMILLRERHLLAVRGAILALDLRLTLQTSHLLHTIKGPVDRIKILLTQALAVTMSLRRDREIGMDLEETHHQMTT